MSTSRRVAKNFILISVAEIAARILGAILSIYVARILGVNAFGQLAFATAFITFFNVFADMGLTTFGIREIAKNRENTSSYGTTILVLQLMLASLLLLLLAVILIFLPIDNRTKLITFIFGIGMLPAAINMSYIFQAYERMEFTAITRIVSQIGYAILGFSLVIYFRDIIVLPIALAITALMGSVIALYLLRAKLHFMFAKFDLGLAKQMVKKTLPFLLAALSVQVYYNIDSVMLQFMKDANEVGYYNAGYKIVLLLIAFAGFMQSAIFPTFTVLYHSNKEKAKQFVTRSSRMMMLLFMPISAGGMILAPEIINFVYDSGYQKSVLSFQILIWTVFTIFSNLIFVVVMLTSGREKLFAKISIAGAIINLSLNFIMIPIWGLNGAAAATLFTEVVVLAAILYGTREYISIVLLKYALQALLCSAIMSLILVYLKLPLFVELFIGLVTYFISMVSLKFVDIYDLHFIKSLVRRNTAQT